MEDLIARIREALDCKQRTLDAALKLPGGDSCERDGHWHEEDIQAHLAADRKILDMWVVDHHGDLTAEIPGENMCDDLCVRVIGEHILKTLAEAYGISLTPAAASTSATASGSV